VGRFRTINIVHALNGAELLHECFLLFSNGL